MCNCSFCLNSWRNLDASYTTTYQQPQQLGPVSANATVAAQPAASAPQLGPAAAALAVLAASSSPNTLNAAASAPSLLGGQLPPAAPENPYAPTSAAPALPTEVSASGSRYALNDKGVRLDNSAARTCNPCCLFLCGGACPLRKWCSLMSFLGFVSPQFF